MVAQAIHDIAKPPALPAERVIFLLDGFAALGRLDPVGRAFALMVSYGIQLLPILRDLEQLRASTASGREPSSPNGGLVQIFNVADIDTANWSSISIGTITMSYQTTGTGVAHVPLQPFNTSSPRPRAASCGGT